MKKGDRFGSFFAGRLPIAKTGVTMFYHINPTAKFVSIPLKTVTFPTLRGFRKETTFENEPKMRIAARGRFFTM